MGLGRGGETAIGGEETHTFAELDLRLRVGEVRDILVDTGGG